MWTGWKEDKEKYEGEQRKTTMSKKIWKEKQHTLWTANYLAEIFNSEKEYGSVDYSWNFYSKTGQLKGEKKRGTVLLHNGSWNCKLIFLGKDSGWII